MCLINNVANKAKLKCFNHLTWDTAEINVFFVNIAEGNVVERLGSACLIKIQSLNTEWPSFHYKHQWSTCCSVDLFSIVQTNTLDSLDSQKQPLFFFYLMWKNKSSRLFQGTTGCGMSEGILLNRLVKQHWHSFPLSYFFWVSLKLIYRKCTIV